MIQYYNVSLSYTAYNSSGKTAYLCMFDNLGYNLVFYFYF